MRPICFIVVVIAGLGLISTFADLPARLPSEAELVGNWVGYEAELPYFFRLNFQQDGKGSLVILYPKSNPVVKPDIYKIEHWEIQERHLLLHLSPTEAGSEGIVCSVKQFSKTRIKLEIHGATNRWDQTVLLLNESELNENISNSVSYLQIMNSRSNRGATNANEEK